MKNYYRYKYGQCLGYKITVMGIFTEKYSFGFNAVRNTNFLWNNLPSNFCGEQIEFISKICAC